MKKRFYSFFVLMLIPFLLIGCNSGGSDADIDYTEFVGIPTNLVITNKTLSWNAVSGAKGYNIYLNGEMIDSINTTSYDFSNQSETKLIFQVQTDAPRGYQDSPLSVSIAYVQNRAEEIILLNSLVQATLGDVPIGFVEELVNKGMVSADFSTVQEILVQFVLDISESDGDFVLINQSLSTLLSSDMNYEALISAFMLYLPNIIDGNIGSLEEEIDGLYEEYDNETNPDIQATILTNIQLLEAELEVYTLLKDSIENSRDDLLLSLLHTLEYLISIHSQVSDNLITNLVNLGNIETIDDVVAEEIILIKDEIVAILLDNLPSMEDMIMMYEMINVIQLAMTSSSDQPQYPLQSAAHTILSIEAFAKMLDTIDVEYVNNVKGYVKQKTPNMANAEIMILTIKYLDRFKSENKGLIDEIREVLTVEQQAELFDYYANYISLNYDNAQDVIDISKIIWLDDLAYETIYYINNDTYDLIDPLLDWFGKTDGEIIRQAVILEGYNVSDNNVYSNDTLNIIYSNETDYQIALQNTQFLILKYVLEMEYVLSKETTDADVKEYADLVFALIPFEDYFETSNLNNVRTNVKEFFDNQAINIYTLVKGFLKYENDNEVIEDLIALNNQIDNYLRTKYGNDYLSQNQFQADPYQQYAYLIFLGNLIDRYMTSSYESKLDALINDFFVLFKTQEFLAMYDLSITEMDEYETIIETEIVDYILSTSSLIKNYDVNSLSLAQKAVLEELVLFLETGPDFPTK